MASPYVREVGTVSNDMGETVSVGVDHDAVGIYIGGWLSADGITLSQDQCEQFAQAFVAAAWQAGENLRRMATETPSTPLTGSSRKIGREWCRVAPGVQARLVSFGGENDEAYSWVEVREHPDG